MNETVARLYADIGVKISGALSGLREFRTRLGQAQSGLKTLRDQSKITQTAIETALVAPIALLGKTALESIGDYQKAMGVFQLVTKASAEEMTKAGDAINAVAHDLALPQFSKSDAAEALLRLGQAGLGAQGAIDALRPALLLAAAGEVSATQGADLLANSLNAWHLKAQDANATADILAATMKNSGLSMNEVAQAVQNAGADFAAAGVPIDVFGTLLAEVGKAGFSGSVGATALRNIIQSLAAPTEQQSGLLHALGVQVYDAQGKMLPFRDILGQLHDGFAKLTPAQQEAWASTLFGKDAMGAALAIIRGGLPTYDDMHDKITTVGIAQEIAKTKAEGLSGATADLTREARNASTSALEPMADDLAKLEHGLADVLRAFQKLPAPVQEGVAALGGLLVVLAAAQLAWTILGPAIGTVTAALGLLAPALELLATGPLSLIILAVGGLALVFRSAYDNIKPFHDAVDTTFTFIDGIAKRVTDTLKGFTDAFQKISGIRIDFAQIIQGIPIVNQLIEIYNALKRLTGAQLPSIPFVNVGGSNSGGGSSSGGGGRAMGWVGGVPVGNGNFGVQSAGMYAPAGGDSYQVNFNAPVYANDIEDMVVRAIEQARRSGRTV